ncbi:MAG TPA: hypothetical protein VFZ78_11915 [Flavisolibacter sp.]
MKPYSRLLIMALRVMFFIAIIAYISVTVISWKTATIAADVWEQLGLSAADADLNIKNSFLNGGLYYFGAKRAKEVAPGSRVGVVNQVVAYSKKYVASSTFKKEYTDYRERMKPAPPQFERMSADDIREQERQRLQKALKVAEEGLNSPNPKIKNGAPARIENLKKELAAIDQPDNPAVKRRLDQEERMYQQYMKQHNDALQKFETRFPAEINVLLKQRLREILDVTADVDYAAELREERGKKFFVNPAYEKKSKGWKLAFRAGKETTDAVRSAATQWLNELK